MMLLTFVLSCRPGNGILFPGTTFCEIARYCFNSATVQVMPEFSSAAEYAWRENRPPCR